MPRRKNITRDAKDAVMGDIFWLSPRPSEGEGSQINKEVRDIFDHPVLVLSMHTDENVACVLILSSLKGKNINEYSANTSIRALHLPIHPAPAHPDSGKILFLDNGLRLQKDTNVKLKTRYLLPFHLINFSYCDHRTQQKYTLQSVSFDIVRGAVDSSRPAVYPAAIGDLPSLIGRPKRSVTPLPEPMRPTHTPRRPLAESSHNARPVTYSTNVSQATNIGSSHSVRPITNGTHLPKATNFASSHKVQPAPSGNYLLTTTDFSRGNIPQGQSFRTPLLADVSRQHTRWHYDTDLERQRSHQLTRSGHTVDGTRSRHPSCCKFMLFILGILLFFLFMALYLGIGVKA